MDTKSAQITRLVHGFGVRTGVQDNVLCVDESTTIFPVGRALAQLNMETRAMSFVSEGEKAELVLALALAPSRRCGVVPSNSCTLTPILESACALIAARAPHPWQIPCSVRARRTVCAGVDLPRAVAAPT